MEDYRQTNQDGKILSKYSSLIWRRRSNTLFLDQNEVHVWRAFLDVETSFIHLLKTILSEDEKDKSKRYRFSKDRDQFIIARGLLRNILSCYLDLEPIELKFSYGPDGKPSLVHQPDGCPLNFNLSHSQGIALYAVARNRELGIDLEKIMPDFYGEHIPEYFFSQREIAKLRALPVSVQAEAFYNCWTRKEAYLKAKGGGLALELNQFEVSFAPDEQAAILNTNTDPKEKYRWSLTHIDPGKGYTGALVVEGFGWHPKFLQWETHLMEKNRILISN